MVRRPLTGESTAAPVTARTVLDAHDPVNPNTLEVPMAARASRAVTLLCCLTLGACGAPDRSAEVTAYLTAAMAQAQEAHDETGQYPASLDAMSYREWDGVGHTSLLTTWDLTSLCIQVTFTGPGLGGDIQKRSIYSTDPKTVYDGQCDTDQL